MSSIFGNYFTVKENKQGNRISGFQTFVAYLGGSAFQTVMDNPVTAYRQLVQQCVCTRRAECTASCSPRDWGALIGLRPSRAARCD